MFNPWDRQKELRNLNKKYFYDLSGGLTSLYKYLESVEMLALNTCIHHTQTVGIAILKIPACNIVITKSLTKGFIYFRWKLN